MRLWSAPFVLCAVVLVSVAPARAACDRSALPAGTEVAEVQTALGSICIELLRNDAPLHVENFLFYLQNGLLSGTFFHRSLPGFVLQGGGFTLGAEDFEAVPALNGPVTNEPCTLDTPLDSEDPGGIQICSFRGNERGTVALAKLGSDPNSGTTNWFFNLADNRGNLDNQNGGFTVFGRVIGDSMDVVDAIAALPVTSLVPSGPNAGLSDDLVWIETVLERSPIPLREPLLLDAYGCLDPTLQVTLLATAALPSLAWVPDPVLVPVVPPLVMPYTLSSSCGTPTSLPFVPDPGSPSCQDPQPDRIAVATTGPRSLLTTGLGLFRLTCLQVEEALAQRALWLADYEAQLKDNLVFVTSTSVQSALASVPMLPAFAAGLFACLLLVAGCRRFA